MISPSLRKNVVRALFLFAILVFSTGLMKFFGVRSRPLSIVHHFSGLFLIASAVSHMVINRKQLGNAFGFGGK